MGSYVYRISRKYIQAEIEGKREKIYIAEYAYKPYWFGCDCEKNNATMYRYYVAPTKRAWERAKETPKYFVMSHRKGTIFGNYPAAEVYKAYGVSFYDTDMEMVGKIAGKDGDKVVKFLPKLEISEANQHEGMCLV